MWYILQLHACVAAIAACLSLENFQLCLLPVSPAGCDASCSRACTRLRRLQHCFWWAVWSGSDSFKSCHQGQGFSAFRVSKNFVIWSPAVAPLERHCALLCSCGRAQCGDAESIKFNFYNNVIIVCADVLNLIYDAMPQDFVTLVVTEFGAIPPTSVPVILREYRQEPTI